MKKLLITLIILLNVSTCAAADNFCWKYFTTLNKNENIFYSPYGIETALGILANGASGDTQKEILNALNAVNVETLNKNFSANIISANLLLIDKKVIGNGINKNFKRVVNDIYNSDVREADFENNLDGEKLKITRWVSDKTKNFIPNYQSIATKSTLTDLLNVVYFKEDWLFPFKAEGTAKNIFKNRDGSISEVDMMNKTFKRKISYREDENFKGIVLPYTSGAKMCLIMPKDDADLNIAEKFAARADFLDKLKNSSAFNGDVVVRIPKFELDIENNLVESFKALGIKKSFTDDAEFFNIINDTSLKIGNAQHRAKIKIDEQGTEAAAVTEIAMVETTAAFDAEPPKKAYFIADRPFLFVIRDVQSDKILFAGVVNHL